MQRVRSCALALAWLTLPLTASAVTVDGKLDAGYTQVSVQTTQADPGPNSTGGAIDFAPGSELDGAWATVDQGVLYLFFSGNLKDWLCSRDPCTDPGILEVFIDAQPGGQNVLLGPTPAPFGQPFAGLTFDVGFAPDHVFELVAAGALDHSFFSIANYVSLPTGGGGTQVALGNGHGAGGPGTLTGGTNPFGIQVTLDNSNVAGVTAGCSAAAGSGVTTGIEWAIPLAAIGNPTGCLKLCALMFVTNEFGFQRGISNQVLGPAPPGTCVLGPPSGVNFSNIAGDQFFAICLGPTAALHSTWGRLKRAYR